MLPFSPDHSSESIMTTEITIEVRPTRPTVSRFRTRWGSELSAHEGNPDFVLSLARGLRVIESFEGHPDGLSVAEISRATALSRAAVRRLLITLELLGYLEAGGRRYRLRHRVLHLGLSYLSSNSLAAVAQPAVQRITEDLRESSSVCVLEGDEVLCIAGAVRKGIMSLDVSAGNRLPAPHCTAVGRVLLAALPENKLSAYLDRVELKPFTSKTIVSREVLASDLGKVRRQGFSVIDEELELSLRAIAVPIVSTHVQVTAALGVGAPSSRACIDELQARFLPLLQEHARVIGQFAS
jgi:IclR family pca regulon transcriptional regulator